MAKEAKKTQVKKNNKEDMKKVVKEELNVKEESNEKVKVKKVKEKKNHKENAAKLFEKIDSKRIEILVFVVGFVIATILFRCILWPDRIATLKDGTQPIASIDGKTFTADDLYSSMKEYYSVTVLLNNIDDEILTKIYPENDEMKDEIKSTAEYYYSAYESYYGYTKAEFLSKNNFESEQAFLDSLKLDYRRNKYYDEYVEGLITDKEIDKYYDDEVFGDVDSKHILVSTKDEDSLSDDEAKALAEEIIGKLNSGSSWDDVTKEYKDKIVVEELGYNAFNASLEEAYLKECKNLKVDSYSSSPVKTSYGYHVVYKIAQKDKPELKDVKEDIIDAIAADKKEADENLYYKALVNMREEKNLKFDDTKFEDEYKDYIKQYK